ncbi:MAG: hypothetical protein KJZ95_06080 [Caldilinea sp.]|nr:hypothetical protein [Caldilinea sp.]
MDTSGAPVALLPEQWLEERIKSGEEVLYDASPRPTATEILTADRNRLKPR